MGFGFPKEEFDNSTRGEFSERAGTGNPDCFEKHAHWPSLALPEERGAIMLDSALVCLQVVLLYLLADVIGGVLHWAEDTLGRQDTPVWGTLFVKPNILHHDQPAAMLKASWLRSNGLTFSIAAIVVCLVWISFGMSWQLLLLGVFGGMNQQVHRFAHARRQDLPKAVILLQRLRIFQDARHHWVHHRKPNNRYFCVMTPLMNPLLEKIGFWFLLERIFVPIFGAPRREDLQRYRWYRSRALWD